MFRLIFAVFVLLAFAIPTNVSAQEEPCVIPSAILRQSVDLMRANDDLLEYTYAVRDYTSRDVSDECYSEWYLESAIPVVLTSYQFNVMVLFGGLSDSNTYFEYFRAIIGPSVGTTFIQGICEYNDICSFSDLNNAFPPPRENNIEG
jgi:hypothetical protein